MRWLISLLRPTRQAVIGIVASIAGVVTLLCILIAVHFFLQRRRGGRTHRARQQTGIEGAPDFTEPGVSLPLDPQSARSSGNVINKPTPYPMENYTSAPTSPYFVQSMPSNHALDRYQHMRSLNAATADLDQIICASVFTPNGTTKAWSPTRSPSTPHSRGVQSSEPSPGTREQPKATIPISPLSYISNFRDSIIPTNYVRMGTTEVESGTGDGGDRSAARRSSMAVTIHRQGTIH